MASNPPRGHPTLQRLSNQTEEITRSVQRFKISGLSALEQKRKPPCIIPIAPTRTHVGRHDMEIEFNLTVPVETRFRLILNRVALTIDPSVAEASFTCCVLDPPKPARPYSAAKEIAKPGQDMLTMSTSTTFDSGDVKDDSIIVECVVTVQHHRTLRNVLSASAATPSSDLHEHFGELLRSQKGADVTFLVSGEAIAAHRCVLAARSLVFMAELLGDMREKDSQQIEIEDMEADVFRALIEFIYTDTLPELADSHQEEDTKMLSHHLLAAADRYGMERLKLICQDKICADISVETAATALVLAEQHECSKLKASCMEFIVANPNDIEVIMNSDGYKYLMQSCPSLASELVVFAVKRAAPTYQ